MKWMFLFLMLFSVGTVSAAEDCTFCDPETGSGVAGQLGAKIQCKYTNASGVDMYQTVDMSETARGGANIKMMTQACIDATGDAKAKYIGITNKDSTATLQGNKGGIANIGDAQAHSGVNPLGTSSTSSSSAGIGSVNVGVGAFDPNSAINCNSLCDCGVNEACMSGKCTPFAAVPNGVNIDLNGGTCVSNCTGGQGMGSCQCVGSHSYSCYQMGPPPGSCSSDCDCPGQYDSCESGSCVDFSSASYCPEDGLVRGDAMCQWQCAGGTTGGGVLWQCPVNGQVCGDDGEGKL